jgi:tRNA dimethylallyltransferase
VYFVFLKVPEKKLYVIVGPTAVGKTGFAFALAKQLNTEIVSADSRQVYKELNIGTAKPSASELATVKHHFINSHAVQDGYNAGEYGRDAENLLKQLFTRYNEVVMVGGSGLYIKAALDGFDTIPSIPNNVREQLEQSVNRHGIEWLQAKLSELDPDLYKKIDQQNVHRLMRALEVKLHTGRSVQDFQGQHKKQHHFTIVKIGLELNSTTLYERIDARMDKMIEAGLFEEAKSFYPLRHLNALQTVGYREIFDFIDGEYDLAETMRLLKRNSRRYAKRQLTWFRRDPEIRWFDAQLDAKTLLDNMDLERK